MSWRAFQIWFFFGCAVALYSQYDGATGIRTLGDVAGGGLIFGFLGDALYFALRTTYRLSANSP